MSEEYLNKNGVLTLWNKVKSLAANKQDTLVSGTNIKTINNTSLLGSGNITVGGGGGGGLSFDDVYPIGSIYISVSSTDPGTLFGGTWESIPGRFLVGAGNNNASGNEALNLTAGDTGGEKNHPLTASETAAKNHSHTYAKSKTATDSHTLTVSEIPAHKHNINERNNSGTSTGWSYMTENGKYAASGTRIANTGGGGGHTHGIGTASATTTGNPTDANGAAHNNMPPYLAVYMWKRIA